MKHMKRLSFIYSILFLGLFSCDYDDGVGDYKADLIGGTVQQIIVSPSTLTLYVDSELPTLSHCIVPIYAADTTVTWSSSRPDVLNVDPNTGALSWGTIANSEVIITATSNSNNQATGQCVVTVQNVRNLYKYVDARKNLGLWILDKNIGATGNVPAEGGWGWTSLPTVTGNYYQWGNNEPAANLATGGDNGKGYPNQYTYPNGEKMQAGLPGYDPDWSDQSSTFKDWSNPENLPGGMDGWRLPTKEELEKVAYYINPDNFRTAQEKGEAKLLCEELGFVATGAVDYDRPDYPNWDNSYSYYGFGYCILWSSDYDPVSKKAWCLQVEQTTTGIKASVVQYSILGMACPIRLVRNASDFDNKEEQ